MVLTWMYSVLLAMPIAITQLKHRKTKYTYWNFHKKLKIWTRFPQKRDFEIKREDGRQPLKTGVSIQNGRVRTYNTRLAMAKD